MDLALAQKAFEFVVGRLNHIDGSNRSVRLVGSARRKCPQVRDIDILVVLTKAQFNGNGLKDMSFCSSRRPSGPHKFVVLDCASTGANAHVLGRLKRSITLGYCTDQKAPRQCTISVDIFATTKEFLPAALLHHTGSKEFNIMCRARAKAKGMKLNQYGCFANDDQADSARLSAGVTTEKGILKLIGVEHLRPEDRHPAKFK